MSQAAPDAPYRSRGGWQSVELPYVGKQLVAYAVLPPKDSTRGDVTGAMLTALTRGASTKTTEVEMPSVDLAQTHELADPLRALGLPEDGPVDYSGPGPQVDAISQVVQKVVLKVDQKGTEAAAATGVAFLASTRVLPRPLVLDRPYLLLVQDVRTGTPLVLARVGDPTRR